MKQLPDPLAPWQRWLALFPDDLAAPLADIMLRLHPHVGTLRTAPASADALPEGVGSIVRRGSYERLLMTQWLYADAEPDEFLRRAANGELLFMGPEPAARKRARRCVVLFDMGPSQLGEPRLLHIALFILLARRAEEAGAMFEWGVLQGQRHLRAGGRADTFLAMRQARTFASADAAAAAGWQALLDRRQDDVWVIGGADTVAPACARMRVAITCSLLGDSLEAAFTSARATSKVRLTLPPAEVCVRLLRGVSPDTGTIGRIRQAEGKPSHLQPPRFSPCGAWIAVAQLGGAINVYHVPQSTRAAPGKFRRCDALAQGNVLGLAVIKRNLARVISDGSMLTFQGFTGAAIAPVERPDGAAFRAPAAIGRWLQTFCLSDKVTRTDLTLTHIVLLDLDRQLVSWTASAGSIQMQRIGHDVIGAVQYGDRLLFACAAGQTTVIHSWRGGHAVIPPVAVLPHPSRQAFFGARTSWNEGVRHGLIALRGMEYTWSVITPKRSFDLAIMEEETVLGVAKSARTPKEGLVLRSADKLRIEMRGDGQRRVLVSSPEPIIQASMNQDTGAIAWIGERSSSICVQGIDKDKPYLTVVIDEVAHRH